MSKLPLRRRHNFKGFVTPNRDIEIELRKGGITARVIGALRTVDVKPGRKFRLLGLTEGDLLTPRAPKLRGVRKEIAQTSAREALLNDTQRLKQDFIRAEVKIRDAKPT